MKKNILGSKGLRRGLAFFYVSALVLQMSFLNVIIPVNNAEADFSITIGTSVGTGTANGSVTICGNGAVEPGEECDDGNLVDTDSCRNDCTLPFACEFDLDVMMVMDRSGSMNYDTPTRLSQAKIAANDFLSDLKASDQSGLVSYANTASLDKTLSNNHAQTQGAISALSAVGATNIGDAINLANGELTSVRADVAAEKIMILLTDGKANKPSGPGYGEFAADVAYALTKAGESASAGIKIFTIGLGLDFNETMLRQIASSTNGQYYFAPNSNDLKDIFIRLALEICEDEPACGDGNVDSGEECDDGNSVDTDACKNDCTLPAVCETDLDVMMVMDRSGSMKYDTPTRLSQAKTAANNFLGDLQIGDQSGLVSYANTASLDKTLSNNHAETQSAISVLSAVGATNIGDAINLANGELTSIRANSAAEKVMILLTDGKANKPSGPGYGEFAADVAYALAKAGESSSAGIRIFTIGLGLDFNETMLRQIASSTNGQYYFAPTAQELDDIFDLLKPEICGDEPACGDGTVDPGEECDDGNIAGGDGCSAICETEQTGPVCGDGAVDPGEECDDGNSVDADACQNDCTLPAVCEYDLDVIIAMDRSGSMNYDNPTRLSQAKTAANNFLADLKTGDQSGLVSYANTAALNKTLSNSHNATQAQVNGLSASGATNIGDAIDLANGELTSVRANSAAEKVMILLTDGKANKPNGPGYGEFAADVAYALAKAGDSSTAGIKIFTIGLGLDINTAMLEEIASTTGGKYYFAPTAQELGNIFTLLKPEICDDEPYCGDLNKNGNEECDGTDGVGPHQSCSESCTLIDLPYCGDGIKNGTEECDDGNLINDDQCQNDCSLPSVCEFDLDVMMVMDRSGSMNYNSPTRLSQAKIAANDFLSDLKSGDQSGLVSYANTASLDKTLSNNHVETQSAISALSAVGATNIGDAINLANGELTSVRANSAAEKVMILLTDGKANKPSGPGFGEYAPDVAYALAKAGESASSGIKIFTIGLGSDINAVMLEQIASTTGGKYYFAPTAQDLEDIFAQITVGACHKVTVSDDPDMMRAVADLPVILPKNRVCA